MPTKARKDGGLRLLALVLLALLVLLVLLVRQPYCCAPI